MGSLILIAIILFMVVAFAWELMPIDLVALVASPRSNARLVVQALVAVIGSLVVALIFDRVICGVLSKLAARTRFSLATRTSCCR